MKNSDYLSVFCHVLLPVAYEVDHFWRNKTNIYDLLLCETLLNVGVCFLVIVLP